MVLALSPRLKLREIGALLGLDSKVVDNAKTRAAKLQKIIRQYGSLSIRRFPADAEASGLGDGG